MAARRLLIVMLILLGLSTLAAALVPPQSLRQGSDTTTSSTEVQPTETTPVTPAEILGQRSVLTVGPKTRNIPVVRVAPGEQLALTIRSDRSGLLEIPTIGRFEPVAKDSPAYFNLLLDDPDSYAINLIGPFQETGRLVARIVVRKISPAEARAGRGKARGGGRRGRSQR